MKLLTHAEEIELFKQIEQGDTEARDKVVMSNIRLAMFIAKKRARFGDFSDLLQAAYIGLLTAVDRFEWRRGHRFSTYAFWWINQNVSREAEQNALVHEPSHVTALRRRAELCASEFDMSDSDIIRHLDVKASALARARQTGVECINIDDVSMNLEAETYDLDSSIDASNAAQMLLSIISCLPQREEQIIRLRYGISDVDRQQFIIKDPSELVYYKPT